MSPFSTFQGMREPDPLATFVPWTEAIIASQPDLAYIHMVEPRISGGSDVLEDLHGKGDSLDPIRDIATRNGMARIVAGGFTPETALKHAELTGDLIAMGRNFIGMYHSGGWSMSHLTRL
jgi:NADPH2 dehydrogenase